MQKLKMVRNAGQRLGPEAWNQCELVRDEWIKELLAE